MSCESFSEAMVDFLSETLEGKSRKKLQRHLDSCSACATELESLRAIWTKLQSMPEVKPTENLRTRFYSMLKAYDPEQWDAPEETTFIAKINAWLERWWPKQPAFQFGLAAALLIFGFLAGSRFQAPKAEIQQLQNQLFEVRQLVTTSLLQNQSTSERLRGVGYSYLIEQPNEETLKVLLNTLNYDPNLNVRLATVDALSLFYDREIIRQGVIESLTRQSSPLIQMALIDLLLDMKEKGSLETLNLLQQNEVINQTVRNRAGKAIERLK